MLLFFFFPWTVKWEISIVCVSLSILRHCYVWLWKKKRKKRKENVLGRARPSISIFLNFFLERGRSYKMFFFSLLLFAQMVCCRDMFCWQLLYIEFCVPWAGQIKMKWKNEMSMHLLKKLNCNATWCLVNINLNLKHKYMCITVSRDHVGKKKVIMTETPEQTSLWDSPLYTAASFLCTWAAGSSWAGLCSWTPASCRTRSQSPWRCPLWHAP